MGECRAYGDGFVCARTSGVFDGNWHIVEGGTLFPPLDTGEEMRREPRAWKEVRRLLELEASDRRHDGAREGDYILVHQAHFSACPGASRVFRKEGVADSGDFLYYDRVPGLREWLREVGEDGVWTLYRVVLVDDGRPQPTPRVRYVRDWTGGDNLGFRKGVGE